MCRHLGWLGKPRSLAALMLEPPHGLLVQSYAPRRQQHGLLNADGWGAGFYDIAGSDEPRRWRSAMPLWGDTSFASVAPALSSHCVVAAVRSATVGMPIEASATAPFTDGTWLLSHNGVVDTSVLPTCAGAESVCDSAILAASIFSRGVESLGELIVEVGAADPRARLNIVAANGSRLLATTWGDSLSMLHGSDGVVLASEPYDDDPRWIDIPDRHLIDARGGEVSVTALEGSR
ncbi:ergothioneine biosynthesis protein EgtC [Mycolicibacter kumamotonensis]|uniref:Gamma-glutamyl-hercynylcysteine sulfoxide hydrolase n=1 Tax=Mycolicibacter kumamotonensis TaxID=354243 RepID=A0A7K3LDQ3_9MYCO|nr:ergothioneine biosynthesis protein EgtC [Mycolicibacter kumamotonensis]NDJ89746.1 ergothioneine biosynthesis protein EgtC [Mycolicibacter kumamotonensis]